jgi:hypothetical protein
MVKDPRTAEFLSRAESLYANVELRGPRLDSHTARNQQIEMVRRAVNSLRINVPSSNSTFVASFARAVISSSQKPFVNLWPDQLAEAHMPQTCVKTSSFCAKSLTRPII